MQDRAIIGLGLAGAVLAAICCVTPLLPIVLGALGLSSLLAYVYSDAVLFSVASMCLMLAGFGFWRSRRNG